MAIGDIAASRRTMQPMDPRIGESSFGANIGPAIARRGDALNERDRLAALAEAQGNSARDVIAATGAQVDYLTFSGELSREMVLLGQALRTNNVGDDPDVADNSVANIRTENPHVDTYLAANASSFTEGRYYEFAEGYIRDRITSFSSTLPADLSGDYADVLEKLTQSHINSAFSMETQALGEDYVRNANRLVDIATRSLAAGDTTLETWQGVFQGFLDNSPLQGDRLQLLEDQIEQSLLTAEATSVAQIAASDPNFGYGVVDPENGGLAAAGIPAPMAGVLRAIGSVEANGYDILHGGGRITDFSSHPNTRVDTGRTNPDGTPIYSTAAGRYQIIHSTWQRAANALGLTDFSPESQDRAAVWIATTDYNAHTGRDLMTDLNSGNGQVLANVRRVLSRTWEGLLPTHGNMTDTRFADEVRNGEGTLNAVLDSARYSPLSPERREAIASDSLNYAAELRTQQAAEDAAAHQQMYSQLQVGLMTGKAGMQDILDNVGNLSVSEYSEVIGLYEEHQADLIDLQAITAALGNEETVFDPTDPATERQTNLRFIASGGLEAFQNRDEDYMETDFFPVVERTGIVPEAAAASLQAMARSNDPAVAGFAHATIARIMANNEMAALNGFSSAAIDNAAAFNAMAQNLSPVEAVEQLRVMNSPGGQQIAAQFNQLFAAENSARYVHRLSSVLSDLGLPAAGMAGAALQSDYTTTLKQMYSLTGDMEAAREATIARLATRWGTSIVGGEDRVMRYPPERYYSAIDGNYDHFDEIIRHDLNLTPEQDFYIVSSAQTAADINAGIPPSYNVVLMENGLAAGIATDERGRALNITLEMTGEAGDAIRESRVQERLEDKFAGMIEATQWGADGERVREDLAAIIEHGDPVQIMVISRELNNRIAIMQGEEAGLGVAPEVHQARLDGMLRLRAMLDGEEGPRTPQGNLRPTSTDPVITDTPPAAPGDIDAPIVDGAIQANSRPALRVTPTAFRQLSTSVVRVLGRNDPTVAAAEEDFYAGNTMSALTRMISALRKKDTEGSRRALAELSRYVPQRPADPTVDTPPIIEE